MEVVCLSGFVSALQDILGGVFDAVLAPVLRDVFNILVNIFGQLLQQILSNFLIRIWIIFLKLVYFIEQIFNVFSGISPVEVRDVSRKMPLLEYFFHQDTVKTAFLVITVLSVALAFLATIIGVTKSMSDMALEDKAPISTVLRQALKAAVTFAVIPITCLFLLQTATTMVTVVNTTFNYEQENVSVSDVLFITVASSAAKNQNTVDSYSSGQKYEDAEAVQRDFDITRFNFVQAYISAFMIAIIMLCSILQFIQRIIMVLLLYLSSPFFVAVMPLDGGAKFHEWKNMFVAHMMSAFGPIISMKIYFIIMPFVAGNQLDFNVGHTLTSWIKLFFMIGGAFAVYRSRLLLVNILNPAAAGAMAESGIIGAFIGGKLTGALRGAVARSGRSQKNSGHKKGGGGGSGSSSNQYKTLSQAYTGK